MNHTKKVLLLAILAIAPSLSAGRGSGWGWGLGLGLLGTAAIASAANRDRYVYTDPYYARDYYDRSEVFYSRNGNPYTLDRWGNRIYLRTARPVYRNYRY